MLAFALRADGWYLRQDIIWHKPNPMPESVRDRCTKAHEYIFLLSKSERYFFDSDAIKEPCKQDWGTRDRSNGKYHNEGSGLSPHSGLEKNYEMANKRSVWSVATKPYKGAHFATFPTELIEPCILAGSRPGDIVLDPFMGSGTTAYVAKGLDRKYVGCELNPEYKDLQDERLATFGSLFDLVV
jgi:DNA modification methylase